MIGHTNRDPFVPRETGGGSKKGKIFLPWPLVYVVAAEAVGLTYYGTMEVLQNKRAQPIGFCDRLSQMLPGWHEERASEYLVKCGRMPDSTLSDLLWNRVYKGAAYSGTSDRGPNHDPRTRNTQSKEHWTRKVPSGHSLFQLHEDIRRGIPRPDWKQFKCAS